MAKIVWILGAGFSKPLGGPLLVDMFTAASAGNLAARYPVSAYPRLNDPAVRLVRWLYQYGLHGADERTPPLTENRTGERLWENAEEFLEFVDLAISPTGSARLRRLDGLIGLCCSNTATSRSAYGDNKHVAATARRLLAAECSAFLSDPRDPHSERWIPYERWWSRVEADHTIISFNYDLVIEHLALKTPSKMVVVRPGRIGERSPGMLPLIKLHGSVDWRRIDGPGNSATYETGQPDDFAMKCEDSELSIASPGWTKQQLIKEHFLSLWQLAHDALVAAEVVVFVGYRFPPTDSEALSRLLAALGQNARNGPPHLALHTVLGPKKSDDIVRLHSLLSHAARVGGRRNTADGMNPVSVPGAAPFYTLVSQPLYAQDFLLVAQPGELEKPYLITW